MDKHKDCIAEFRVLSRSWYADANLAGAPFTDEITMGFYHPDGGRAGEFSIRWVPLCGERPSPQLRIFDDGWDALWQLRRVLEGLAALANTTPTVDKVVAVLLACGLKDATEATHPA